MVNGSGRKPVWVRLPPPARWLDYQVGPSVYSKHVASGLRDGPSRTKAAEQSAALALPPVHGEKLPWYGEKLPWYGEKLPWYGEKLPWYGAKLPWYGAKLPWYGAKLPWYGAKLPW